MPHLHLRLAIVAFALLSQVADARGEEPGSLAPTDPKTWPAFISLKDAQGRDLSGFDYQVVKKPNWRLIKAGATTFGGLYLISGLVGSLGSQFCRWRARTGCFSGVAPSFSTIWLCSRFD